MISNVSSRANIRLKFQIVQSDTCKTNDIPIVFVSSFLLCLIVQYCQKSALHDLSLLQISCVFQTGFSDPYCLLTILEDEEESRTRRSRAKPSKSVVKDAVSDDKIYQTDIKKQTLNPIWNQTFIL